jgi:type I restriction enzyme S subunit
MSRNNWLDISLVPKDWSIIPCGVFFKEKSIKNIEGEINLSVYRDYGVIPKDSRDDNHNRVSEDTSNYKLVEPGDFVINKMKGWSGSLGVSDYRGIVSPSYTVLEPVKEIHNKYFHYLLRSETYRQIYESLSYGVRIGQWELHYHDFKQIPSLYPPIEEQKLISRYLDKKISQIDSLINKIEKKIELLKEQRTSLINQYVTKGLDPNVEMKDSDVEWVKEIPKHWRMYPIKRILLEYFGGSWGDDPIENQTDNLVQVIRVTEFDMNFLTVTKDIPTIRSLNLSTDSKKLVQKNDLILEKSGGGEKTPVGRIVLVDREIDFPTINSNFTNICRPNPDIVDPQFALFSVFAGYINGRTLRNIKQTTGIQNLDLDGFMTELIPLPPIKEQREIASFLKTENKIFLKRLQQLMRYIDLLREYRQSIISSTVTGKVRVSEDML